MVQRDCAEVTIEGYEDHPDPKATYELIRRFHNACEHNNVNQIKSLHQLRGKVTQEELNSNTLFLTRESKINFRNKVIKLLLEEFFINFQDKNNEMLFCLAALFNTQFLIEVIENLRNNNPERLNELKFSDSAILFALKYGDISSDNFVECIKLLIEAPVDINAIDFEGKTTIDHVALLYEADSKNSLIEVAKVMLEKGVFKIEDARTIQILSEQMQIDLDTYTYHKMDDKTKLFFWICKNKTKEFTSFPNISDYVDCDNSENTLLQFACKKTDRLLPVVQVLIRNQVDPNRTTDQNQLTPLELAATQNSQKIFEVLLNYEKTTVDQKQFNNFVRWRGNRMKIKLFEILLESDKLDTRLTYEKTGNTPLHYATYFKHKKAIQILLKRDPSLLLRNSQKNTIIDLINASDLDTYLDSCLVFDHYTPDFSDRNYKMMFRFNCLIDNETKKEIEVIDNIAQKPNLEQLLVSHALIQIFISLKWFTTQKYFWFVLCSQAFIFLFLSVYFFRFLEATTFETVCAVIIISINVIVKLPIFLNFSRNDKGVTFPAMKQVTFHSCSEIFLMILILGTFIISEFRAFIFTTMAISFLLTAGYHPKLSKWSIMLQKVTKTFTILLIFFSLIIISFSIGFHISFKDTPMFKNMTHAVLSTYVMTVGEFNTDDIDFEAPGLAGYIFFFLFVMIISLIILNFWTGAAVSDIEKIEKYSEINALQNVIIFIHFIEYMYTKIYNCLRNRKFKKCIPTPLLFLDSGPGNSGARNYEVVFFPNRVRPFETNKLIQNLPPELDKHCLAKLEELHNNTQTTSREENILAKLEEYSKMMKELKDKIKYVSKQNHSNS